MVGPSSFASHAPASHKAGLVIPTLSTPNPVVGGVNMAACPLSTSSLILPFWGVSSADVDGCSIRSIVSSQLYDKGIRDYGRIKAYNLTRCIA